MPERMNTDGTWTRETDEEARARILAESIAELGEAEGRALAEQRWAALDTPVVDPEDMTESERYLAGKMQSEHEVNAAAAGAGVESIFDLPSEDDDDTWTPPDDWPAPRDYDYEGALRDLEADHPEMMPGAGEA